MTRIALVDDEESILSESVTLTPQSQTVYELAWDDGTSEIEFNAGGGNYTAVRFTAAGNDPLIRLKWYQVGPGGAFYLKMWDDAGGLPSNESFSTIVSGGVAGWNTKEMMDEQITLSGTFWVGAKEFSSTQAFGLDTNSDLGNSYFQVDDDGNWQPIANFGSSGNLMFRAELDHPDGGTETVNVDHMADWNLVGLPMDVSNPYYLSVYPDALEETLYLFNGGYIQEENMIAGEGYWLRFPDAGENTVSGSSLTNVTISLIEDWNLISGISQPFDITNIYDPNNIIVQGTFYGFENGYAEVSQLIPGKSYWVRATQSGVIIINE